MSSFGVSLLAGKSARAIAIAVRARHVSATEMVRAALDRIAAGDVTINSFTRVTEATALSDAAAVDARVAAGDSTAVLAGVPFAVKDLFDVEGLVTTAGSRIRQDDPPATVDATVVARLRAAGAVLVGTTNMDEFAYGFATVNAHHGPTRNPHDPERLAGGSSGGSAAAVAARLVPISLGSDTNGSIRVPAALCGVFGLKPTYGRLSRAGTYPFAGSFDHVGPFAADVADLAAAYDAMAGYDPRDPVCSDRPAQSCAVRTGGLSRPALRVGVLGGYFQQDCDASLLAAIEEIAVALGADRDVELAEAARARAAAFVITAAEGGALHRADLRRHAGLYDPATRDRLIAGALLPASVPLQAQRFRSWFRQQAARLFETYDVLIAPACAVPAPRFDQAFLTLGGQQVPARAHLGLYTQPISFIGLPVLAAPVAHDGGLPLGVQLIGKPWHEHQLFQLAAWLAQGGLVRTHPISHSA